MATPLISNMKKLIFLVWTMLVADVSYSQNYNIDDYQNAYLVVADTSLNYYKLRKDMFDLSKLLTIQIDTLGRGYNSEQDLIIMPHDENAIVWIDGYFPRNEFSETLSIEYLEYYLHWKNTRSHNMALISIVTSYEDEARKNLNEVKKYFKGAFIIIADISTGCSLSHR